MSVPQNTIMNMNNVMGMWTYIYICVCVCVCPYLLEYASNDIIFMDVMYNVAHTLRLHGASHNKLMFILFTKSNVIITLHGSSIVFSTTMYDVSITLF